MLPQHLSDLPLGLAMHWTAGTGKLETSTACCHTHFAEVCDERVAASAAGLNCHCAMGYPLAGGALLLGAGGAPINGSYGGFEQRLLCTLQPQPSGPSSRAYVTVSGTCSSTRPMFSPCSTAGMLTTRLPCHVHFWEGLCNNVVDVCVELLRLTSCPVPLNAVTRGRGMRHNLDGNLGATAEEAE